jgi:lysophospholipase L1-like esterase
VDPWALRQSFLLDFVRSRFAGAARPHASGSGLTEAPHETGAAAPTYTRDADRVPEAYRSLVGLGAFETALGDLVEFCRAHNIPVLALTHGVWFEDEMLAALESNKSPVLVLRSALRQRAREMNAPDYGRSPLAISPTDLHPSAAGHQAIAEELALWLRARSTRPPP